MAKSSSTPYATDGYPKNTSVVREATTDATMSFHGLLLLEKSIATEPRSADNHARERNTLGQGAR